MSDLKNIIKLGYQSGRQLDETSLGVRIARKKAEGRKKREKRVSSIGECVKLFILLYFFDNFFLNFEETI